VVGAIRGGELFKLLKFAAAVFADFLTEKGLGIRTFVASQDGNRLPTGLMRYEEVILRRRCASRQTKSKTQNG
jgi:hypothetical protein